MTENKIYTGIGSRDTPIPVCNLMTNVAKTLDQCGYILRSGGAKGADSAFEAGSTNKQIFLPWKRFNSNPSPLFDVCPIAMGIAKTFHPKWSRLNNSARLFHGRNVYQVLGKDCNSPTDFIICWTSDGKASGGTGQALRIAKHYQIPIYNLYNDSDRILLNTLLKEIIQLTKQPN